MKTLSSGLVSSAGNRGYLPLFWGGLWRRALGHFFFSVSPSPAPLIFWNGQLSSQSQTLLGVWVSSGHMWPYFKGPPFITGKNLNLSCCQGCAGGGSWVCAHSLSFSPLESPPSGWTRPWFPECVSVTLLSMEPSVNTTSILLGPASA